MVAVFVFPVSLYYAIASTSLYEAWIFKPHTILNTKLSGDILAMLGEDDAETRGASIFPPRFDVSIARGCDGIEAMALFIAALFAFPAGSILRLPAIPICPPLLAAANLVRIVSFYLVGAYRPTSSM